MLTSCARPPIFWLRFDVSPYNTLYMMYGCTTDTVYAIPLCTAFYSTCPAQHTLYDAPLCNAVKMMFPYTIHSNDAPVYNILCTTRSF